MLLSPHLLAVLISYCAVQVVLGTNSRTSPDGNYHVEWTAHDDRVIFNITANTTGYVGLGITENGGMSDADIYVGYVAEDGRAYVLDCHGQPYNGAPLIDREQSVDEVFGWKAAGRTNIVFSRKLDTCDSQDKVITSGTQKLIYAFGSSAPSRAWEQAVAAVGSQLDAGRLYHGTNRGHFSVHLTSVDLTQSANIPADARTVDFRMNNIAIPPASTTYWCKVFTIDKRQQLANTVNHLIKANMYIGSDNNTGSVNHPYVHHMLLFKCRTPPFAGWNINNEPFYGADCDHPPSYSMITSCSDAKEWIVGWAVGGTDNYFPSYAGYPVGLEDVEVFMIQVHYDNPHLVAGVRDNSGIGLVLTPTKREHDAGTLVITTSFSFLMSIPPGARNFTLDGHCHRNCTQMTFPPDGIRVFGGFLHTHLQGVKVVARHYRDGVELAPIMRDDTYDFNYQEMISLEKPVQILPGDEIVSECVYDTTNLDRMTYGGLATENEMCMVFLMYYPRMPLMECGNVPPLPMEGMADTINAPPELNITYQGFDEQVWRNYLESYPWRDPRYRESVREFQRGMLSLPVYFYCTVPEAQQNLTSEFNDKRHELRTVPFRPWDVFDGAPTRCSGSTMTVAEGVHTLLIIALVIAPKYI